MSSLSYEYTRLTFKRDVIESLAPSESFRVKTPEGTFEFTRAEFETEFPKVVNSESYRSGLYNYSKTPKRALAFLVAPASQESARVLPAPRDSVLQAFPPEVAPKLKTYVYRLIDPRNGETFYVGKGKGDRVFAHIRAKIDTDDPGDKLKRIHEIRASGFEVGHVIHRHGMDDKTAFEVEAALIDAYPGLTNAVIGAGSSDFGAMHAQEILQRYQAEPAQFGHRAILINVNRSATETSLYEATRYAWKINPAKAERAEMVFSVRQGLIVAAFVADRWLPATEENFPGHEPVPGRFGFIGKEATGDIRSLYIGKRLPDDYRKQGAANPIKYTYK